MVNDRKEFGGARTRLQHGILLGAVLAVIGLGSLFFAGSSVPDAELVGAVVSGSAVGKSILFKTGSIARLSSEAV